MTKEANQWYCKYCKKAYKVTSVRSHTQSKSHQVNKDVYKTINLEKQVINRFIQDFTEARHGEDQSKFEKTKKERTKETR